MLSNDDIAEIVALLRSKAKGGKTSFCLIMVDEKGELATLGPAKGDRIAILQLALDCERTGHDSETIFPSKEGQN